MTLTWPVVAAVLFAALLHAGWNALVKSSQDKALDTALISLCGALAALPVLLVLGPPRPEAWPFILASVVIHVGYYASLTSAYRHGDLGLTYPLMRGTAPLLVALSAAVTLGETLSAMSWVGVLGISMGVLAMGLSPQALERPRALAFAGLNAVMIAMYTVVDGLGVRAAGDPLRYILLLFVLNGWPFALFTFWRRGPAVVLPYMKRRWLLALAGAMASFSAYGIALWAMTTAPVATVAALRETSVLFAAVLGVLFLGERFTPRRVAATCVIALGVMALRMG